MIYPTLNRSVSQVSIHFAPMFFQLELTMSSEGQVAPFNLTTSDGETLFCWHVLPLDIYLDNENEIVQKYNGPVDDLKESLSYKLLSNDPKSRVVVNFHGNAGHIAQGHRPSTYRSLSSIPHTHILTCDYRGFSRSTLRNSPHIPTETGVITDGISLISYLLTSLNHPADRTVILGQSMGTVVASASALYFTNPTSAHLPPDLIVTDKLPKIAQQGFAGIILIAPFPNLPTLLQTYKIRGLIPVLSPLKGYPKLANFLSSRILDKWPTLPRLQAILDASSKTTTPVHITILHSRNDQDIDFRLSETVYAQLEQQLLSEDHVVSEQERRSIHGGERVKRGAFAYRRVEDASRTRSVEMEIVRYGGHNDVVGWSQVNLVVRRAVKGRKILRPGLDVE